MILAAASGTASVVWRNAGPPPILAMTEYIGAHVPRTAVVETIEWELTAVGPHTNYHSIPSTLMFKADVQWSSGQAIDLPYDPLAANPDYLVTGPFSAIVPVYTAPVIETYFKELVALPPYVLYARR